MSAEPMMYRVAPTTLAQGVDIWPAPFLENTSTPPPPLAFYHSVLFFVGSQVSRAF